VRGSVTFSNNHFSKENRAAGYDASPVKKISMTEEQLRECNPEHKSERIHACNCCGKRIEHHIGRRPRFCSKRCRQKGNYVEKVARGDFSGRTIARPTKHQKRNNKINTLERAKSLSTWRVFGPARVVAAEVWDARCWEPAISSGGTPIEIGRLRSRALEGERSRQQGWIQAAQ
jgi:hypothetical protein